MAAAAHGGTPSSAPARGPRCSSGPSWSTTPTPPSWSRSPTSTRPGWTPTTAGSASSATRRCRPTRPPTSPADAGPGAGRRRAGHHRGRHPRRVHRGRAGGRLRRDHREADDRRRAALPAHPRRRAGQHRPGRRSPSTTATTRCTSRCAGCWPAARSARSARCTSSGCSTCATAPTTSAAGTATRPTPAACWCTRPATTSTWSTGGSAPRRSRCTPQGRLFFYGRGRRRHGYARDYDRAHGAPAAADDPFALRAGRQPPAARAVPRRRARRRLPARPNVFAPGVTIEDDMAVLVRYSTGATMTYHLTAYAPWEGYRVMVNGSRGRLELEVVESDYVSPAGAGASRARALHGAEAAARSRRHPLSVRPFWAPPRRGRVAAADPARPRRRRRPDDGRRCSAATSRPTRWAAAPPPATARWRCSPAWPPTGRCATGAPVRVADLLDRSTGPRPST